MRAARIGFHVLMLVLIVMAFGGVFSPPKTGNFAADNGKYILPVIGLMAVWIVGSIVLRIFRKIAKH